MSSIAQLSNLYATSDLLNATFGSISGSSSTSSTASLLNSLTSYYSSSGTSSSYGTNTSKTSSTTSEYLVDLKENASNLSESLAKLAKTDSNSKFDKLELSSDNSAVSVSYTGKDKADDFTVDVKQIALNQKNEGSALRANASAGSGTSLTIQTDSGESKTFNIYAGSGETNADIQKKLAEQINSSKMGVTATIKTDEKKGTSQLVLSSSKTGSENGFSVSGSLANDMGLTKATQKAQDAIYSINSGEEKTSSSNKIELDKNLSITLSKETDKSANISYKTSNKESLNGARELVNNFNALLETAKNFEDKGAERLENRLNGLTETYKASLERVGITTNKNGYLEIDEDKMKESAENGDLKKLFNSEADGGNYGFANRLANLASKAEENPSNFLSLSASDYNKIDSDNRYIYHTTYSSNSSYQNLANLNATGMLFNALF